MLTKEQLSDLKQAAKFRTFLHTFAECSDDIQKGILDMLEILDNPESDEDDRALAIHTLADALFPNPHNGKLGMDLEESESMGARYSDETRQVLEEMDAEESLFAERLERLLKERGMSQARLAELIGVGQPAISNMLKRQCRPQRRTVVRIAEALGVSPKDLWPAISA